MLTNSDDMRQDSRMQITFQKTPEIPQPQTHWNANCYMREPIDIAALSAYFDYRA